MKIALLLLALLCPILLLLSGVDSARSLGTQAFASLDVETIFRDVDEWVHYIEQIIKSNGKATIFVPMGNFQKNNILDPSEVFYHVVPYPYSSFQLKMFQNGTRFPTLVENKSILVTSNNGSDFTIDGIPITHPDIFYNGVIAVHALPAFLDYQVYGGNQYVSLPHFPLPTCQLSPPPPPSPTSPPPSPQPSTPPAPSPTSPPPPPQYKPKPPSPQPSTSPAPSPTSPPPPPQYKPKPPSPQPSTPPAPSPTSPPPPPQYTPKPPSPQQPSPPSPPQQHMSPPPAPQQPSQSPTPPPKFVPGPQPSQRSVYPPSPSSCPEGACWNDYDYDYSNALQLANKFSVTILAIFIVMGFQMLS